VAQKHWKEELGREGEPYTIDNDPEFQYQDAALTEIGEKQAAELQNRVSSVAPELVVVSPMRCPLRTNLHSADFPCFEGEQHRLP